jgi:predicted transcriptional regulator
MKKKMVLTSVHLDAADYDTLKELADKLDKTQSAVMRQALRELAEKHLATAPKTANA